MKNPQMAKAAGARSKAQVALEQRERNDAEFFRERRKQETANKEKTQRLKALRLAKEAADREAGIDSNVKQPKPRAANKRRS